MSAPELDFAAGATGGDVLIREARLLDPRSGLDKPGDLLIRDGEVELGRAHAGCGSVAWPGRLKRAADDPPPPPASSS